MVDEKKIKAITKELNGGKEDGDWQPAAGLCSLTTVVGDTESGFEFQLGTGIVVKAFMNIKTLEIRTFHINRILES